MNAIQELYHFNPWWENKSFKAGYIERDEYLELFNKSSKNKDIVILTGLRRVGKTSLMKLYIEKLLTRISADRILYISLDSYAFSQISIMDIIELFRGEHKIPRNDKIYLFFDEVTYKENYHQQLKNLYDNENIKIFAASSSASLLNDNKGYLTGRARYIEILPLNFEEYLKFNNLTQKKSEFYLLEKYFEDYMQTGGIPEYVLNCDPSYLDSLIDNIIYKDIVGKYKIKEINILKDYFRLLMERAGKILSLNKIAKILGISPDTSKRFYNYFKETFLIYDMERCGKLNERIKSPKKIYVADVGIRNHIIGFKDKGAIFENLFFFKIKKNNPCYIYKDKIEIDFKFQNTIIEVKYNDELKDKQKILFEKIKVKNKITIKNISDYVNYKQK